MLLDVNNVFVNATNHQFDPVLYIKSLPSTSIEYIHIAGHFEEAHDLLVDTHGADVKPQVWELLKLAYECHGVLPTLLERDFNFTTVSDLLSEVNQIKHYQNEASNERQRA
jgi:uncharacterized protein (UPF0276 family)